MTESNGPADENSQPEQTPPTEQTPPPEQEGYWQQQAAAAPPPDPGVQFNPQSGYQYGQDQAPPPPAYPDPQYGQPQYAQPQYGQPQYGQPQYGQPQPQYGQQYPQPGYQPYQSYVAPNHPKATTSLVLGLVSTVGAFMCGLPILAAPFAWVYGYKTRKEIKAAQGQVGGEGMAMAGMILGIVGTVLLALLLILVVILVIVAINDPNAFDEGSSSV